jgi:hypothetical protein
MVACEEKSRYGGSASDASTAADRVEMKCRASLFGTLRRETLTFRQAWTTHN